MTDYKIQMKTQLVDEVHRLQYVNVQYYGVNVRLDQDKAVYVSI
jgi:uncharacterized protein YxjI